MSNESVLIIILLLLNIFSFIIGFILGKIGPMLGVFSNSLEKPDSFFKTNNTTKRKPAIDIDETKYVVDISTKGLEKKYTELGENTISKDNISNSIDR
ncbi:hypothetical protein EBU24_01440, partial [bacterium]|nr:hypothetical protein [bacterium]